MKLDDHAVSGFTSRLCSTQQNVYSAVHHSNTTENVLMSSLFLQVLVMMEETAETDRIMMTSQQALFVSDQKTSKRTGISTLKLFIVVLSFAYFSKALTGTYMKSSITQIERRFDLSSTHVGLIDGSFEMEFCPLLFCFTFLEVGNLLFLAVVSHFGAKLHRPRLIAVGCFLMAVGAFLTGLTHFFMGRYNYDTVVQIFQNDSVNIGACADPQKTFGVTKIHRKPSVEDNEACVKESGSNMWIYVFLGNALRGIGETPVTPLGISYIDDFAKAENSPFYIACLQTVTLLGPMFGFLLGSYCAKLYVDIGYVDMGFLPSLKRLLGTPAYFLLLCGSILKFNSLIGLFTFKAKYMEQQFGQSASRANFLIGVLNLPVVAVGIFLGGLLMKRYKLSVVSGAQLSFATSFMAYLLLLLQFGTKCDNIPVAGLTISYNGTTTVSANSKVLFSDCNRDCSCSVEEWDPVCSDNGITYMSPCLAGCLSSSGYGKNTVFHNCSCVSSSFPAGSSMSVRLGQCPHAKDCSRSFTSYMAVSVLSSFINSLGATPGYMVIIRCISPELKSLALGIQALATRTLGGIPAPMYFGALIDSTCLKWSVKACGGRGACRLYDSDMYRIIFLGLITCLSGSSYFFIIAVIVLLRRQFQKPEQGTQQPKVSKDIELKISSCPTEGQTTASATPTLSQGQKVSVMVVVNLEDGREIHRLEQFSQGGSLISTKHTQEPHQSETLTSTTVETEVDGLKPEKQVKEVNVKDTTVEAKKVDSHTEKESHNKETDPQS
ncbi:Solute carrier organic anion transporter family member 1C1 [Channa argus]|uniref:Solute carrier organic anion transporter family member n=1 Tax=Channa argus TaxID=215402 RepID=A0A6G1QR92_CHAAH|nr:Solute carrier organic anion transporter family member 1C1 [Channa argus]